MIMIVMCYQYHNRMTSHIQHVIVTMLLDNGGNTEHMFLLFMISMTSSSGHKEDTALS